MQSKTLSLNPSPNPPAPNYALQRTGAHVTQAAKSTAATLPPPPQPARHARPSLSLGSLGDSARVPSNERFRRHSKFVAANQAPRFDDFRFRVYRESDGLAFGSFASKAQPGVFGVRQADVAGEFDSAITRSLSRGGRAHTLHAQQFERLDRAAVFRFSPSRAPGQSQLSRHSRLGIHRESGRYSRNSFRASVLIQ